MEARVAALEQQLQSVGSVLQAAPQWQRQLISRLQQLPAASATESSGRDGHLGTVMKAIEDDVAANLVR